MKLKRVPPIREFMTAYDAYTFDPDMDMVDAIDVLLKKRASGLSVVDKEGRLVGILTEKDCLRVLSNNAYDHFDMIAGKVRDYMSSVKYTVDPNMDLFAVAELFLSTNFTYLPILENGKLIGRISRQGMLRGIQAMQRAVEEEAQAEQKMLDSVQHPNSIGALQKLMSVSQTKEQMVAVLSKRQTPSGGQ
ncbi:MAG: CBS domain-containing protein [Candidatus Hydrogenedentes bacterium]|nr:CBS domain-containing protein [Candidatus Hydrogenedentota bacterium]